VLGSRSWDVEDDVPSERVDRMNADGLIRARGSTLEEVRAASRERRTRMLAAFGALEDDSPGADEWFAESGLTHYEEHAGDLARWSRTLRAGP
jgi:hypothetical protein